MKNAYLTVILLCSAIYLSAQGKYLGEPGITKSNGTTGIVNLHNVNRESRKLMQTNHTLQGLVPLHFQSRDVPHGVSIVYDLSQMPVAVLESEQSHVQFIQQRSEESVSNYLSARKGVLHLLSPDDELVLKQKQTDKRQNVHFRYQQVFDGWEVYGAEITLHTRGTYFSGITGRWKPTPSINTRQHILSEESVRQLIHDVTDIREIAEDAQKLLPREQMIVRKVIYYPDGCKEPVLAYHVDVYPIPSEHWYYFLNALDGSLLFAYQDICKFYHDTPTSCANMEQNAMSEIKPFESSSPQVGMMDGDVTAIQPDLTGTNRTIHNYQIGNDYFMIDASRPMYNATQSNMPDEPNGTLWTLDANGTAPQNQNFSVGHVTSLNNTWSPLEVSAHWNSTTAYVYYLTTHGRNSINGNGGNIISLINVRDENGNEMDNAFWNGYAIFYGNGDEAFDSPLAKGLDVAGHEMSHGVIQNTANLEYVGQSGALNESFADVFGVLIDRDDWKVGEEVVNTQLFTTGALRDLSNPHNGGNAYGDIGWQPAHMNEFVNLPNTPQGDNGGVHVNSGIPNRVFFLFASQVGKDVAEDVYYHALSNYLVKSSQFIDARIAVISAAEDLFPAQPQISAAAASAFTTVGIGSGQGGNYEEDIDVNPGIDFVLLTDNTLSRLYIYDPSDGGVVELNAPAPLSRPSVSDDGSIAVYVDQQQTLKAILFDWSAGLLDYQVVDLESNPQTIWRNIAISKDGGRIAFLTEDLDNRIYVYDFATQQEESFFLYNPTTGSGGVSTGDVLYADVMEWDYSGEYVMYDALNEISGSFGDGIRYWDISFVRVWDNGADAFSFGQIEKLFTSLPENVSVGNATFSKNSPHIIAFDFIESVSDIFGGVTIINELLTANLETGRIVTVFENDALAYPSYSRLDNLILFDSRNPQDPDALLTAFILMQEGDKMSPVPNSAAILINGGHLALWASTGERMLTGIETQPVQRVPIAFPNPADDKLSITIPDYAGRAQISMIDQLGRMVYTSEEMLERNSPLNLNLRDLAQGAYLLQVVTTDAVYANQVMIQHVK